MNITRACAVRMAVGIVVAVVNAAGPWLCCCVLSFAAAPPARSAERPVEPPACAHCSHEDHDSPQPASGREPHKECPCRERLAAVADALPVAPEAVHAPVVATGVGPMAELPADHAGRLVETVDQFVSDLPFLPAQVRLRVHHALRC